MPSTRSPPGWATTGSWGRPRSSRRAGPAAASVRPEVRIRPDERRADPPRGRTLAPGAEAEKGRILPGALQTEEDPGEDGERSERLHSAHRLVEGGGPDGRPDEGVEVDERSRHLRRHPP